MNIYAFSEYRAYLQNQIQAHRHVRGYQGQLAIEAGCQRSFLSQVLNSHVELTPDHGANLCRHWKLDEDATEYFLALLNRSRAGSAALREHLDRKIRNLRKKHEDLTERLRPQKTVVDETAATYYSSWHWAAVHIACSVPELQTPRAIAARLGLAPEVVNSVLASLAEMDLVAHSGDRWRATQRSLHLPETSPFNRTNHLNWRWKSLDATPRLDGGGDRLHYTAVFAAAKRDLPMLREMIVELIEDSRKLIAASPEEEIAVMSCDLARL